LFWRFAGAVNHFRQPAPNLAMMVHSRKAQIFERQMTQFRLGLFDGNFA
jgi:hypothetical protein